MLGSLLGGGDTGQAMGLLDLFRRRTEEPTEAPPAAQLALPAPDERVGVGETQTYGGYPENREASADLRGTARQKTFQEMVLNVAIVGSAVRRVYRLIGSVDWTMAPARGDTVPEDAARDAAEFAQAAIVDAMKRTTPIGSWAKRIASAEFFGSSVQEWTMRDGDDPRWPGRLVFGRLDWRRPATIERWDVDDNNTVHGVWQATKTGAPVYLPRAKLVYHVDDELTDAPDGVGLLRHAAETVRRLKLYLSHEARAIKNSANGNLVGKSPRAGMKADRMAAEEIAAAELGLRSYLENHERKDGLFLVLDSKTYKNPDGSPSNVPMWGIEAINAGNDLAAISTAINRELWQVAVSLNIEHTLLGSGGGSLAMQATKSADFYRFVEAILERIAEVIDRDLITPLWEVNGLPPALRPVPQFSRLSFRDISEILAMLAQLSTTGVTLDRADDAVKVLFEFIGLPVLAEESPADQMARRDAAASAVGLDPADQADPEEA